MSKKEKKPNTFKISAEQLLEAVGGIENVNQSFHCATRFRIVLHDDNLVNSELLNKIQNSKGFSKEGNQWQIIFGAGTVNKVYEFFESIYYPEKNTVGSSETITRTKWNYNYSFKTNAWLMIREGVRSFAQIFIPLIPIFIIGGLSLALNNIIATVGVGKFEDGTWMNPAAQIFSLLFDITGGAILGSLPVLIGYTSAKKWGGNPWFGAAIGLVLISPGLVNSWGLNNENGVAYYVLWDPASKIAAELANPNATLVPKLWDTGVHIFDGFPIFDAPLLGYQAQVVPTLLVVIAAVNIEKLMKKISHESVAIITVPLITVITSIILAFVVIGPFGRMIGFAIAEMFQYIFIYTNFPGFGLGGALIGVLYAPLVVTGLHQGFLPIEATLIASTGVSWITPIASAANIGQAMACLSAIIFIKDKKMVGTGISGGISANLGITEPAIFGVNLPLKYVFIGGMIGAMFGGYWLGMTQTVASSMGTASWLGIIQFSFTSNSDIVNWYDKVANSTPWGSSLNGFGIAPAYNFIIAMFITSIASILTTCLLSLAAKNRKIIREINKSDKDGVVIEKLGKVVDQIQKPFKNFKNNHFQKNENLINYIYAPCDGTLLSKDQIEDVAFKNDLMGTTFAVKPKGNSVTIINSPFDGTISNIFPTGHAFIIKSKNETSVLLHIGTETAKLNTEAENLRKLKFIKVKKFIGSKISKKNEIAEFETGSLLAQGATTEILYNVILSETLKEHQNIEILKDFGDVVAGEIIAKIS